MRYMGGKYILGKKLAPIVKEALSPDSIYIEPFLGGFGMMSHMLGIPNLIVANDIDSDLIAFWQMIWGGYVPPSVLSKEEYYKYKSGMYDHRPYEKAFVKYFCSFGGKAWGGYARENKKTNRDYIGEVSKAAQEVNYALQQSNAAVSVRKQRPIVFYSMSFDRLPIVEDVHCVYYLDPPYRGTTKYTYSFDFDKFDAWVSHLSSIGHTVFISEYTFPFGEVVFEKKKKVTLSTSEYIDRTEKLYRV